MTTRRGAAWISAAVGGWFAVAGAGAGAVAQATGAGEPKVGCFRGRPVPACRSFWIVEMQGNTPLAQTERRVTWINDQSVPLETFDHVLEWNLGHMVNLSTTFAIGGVVTAGTGSDGPFTGVKLRARRWLSPDLSLEAEGGLMRTNAMDSRFPAETGGTADFRLNIRDQGSFYVRWDGISLSEASFAVSGTDDPGGFQQAFSVGVGLGSFPALAGSGALGLAFLILIAMLADDLS
jgi:hypothetical protein